jgi:membrane fusion protein, multidrug efflux system
MTDEEPRNSGKGRTGHFVYVLFGILVVGLALLLSVRLRAERLANIQSQTEERQAVVKAGPRVGFVIAGLAQPHRSIEVVGEARPYNQATLYAKLSGYLREIRVDNGDRVTEGQVLAIIESPELDRQYDAAVEDLKNKEIQAKRGWGLLAQKATSLEDAQNRETAAQTARSNTASLLAQKEYEIIRAPITGIVTARFADPGALLQNATTTQTAALPLVTVSQVDKLKVRAYSDQNNANYIKVGDQAEIWDATRSDTKVPAVVSRTSVQLNPNTRTLLLEFDVDNKQEVLVPGSFIRVSLKIGTPPRVEIPANALVFRSGNPFVAVITDQDTVNLRPVVIAYSDGVHVRLASGVKEGERVAVNPGAGISEGSKVQPVKTDQK